MKLCVCLGEILYHHIDWQSLFFFKQNCLEIIRKRFLFVWLKEKNAVTNHNDPNQKKIDKIIFFENILLANQNYFDTNYNKQTQEKLFILIFQIFFIKLINFYLKIFIFIFIIIHHSSYSMENSFRQLSIFDHISSSSSLLMDKIKWIKWSIAYRAEKKESFIRIFNHYGSNRLMRLLDYHHHHHHHHHRHQTMNFFPILNYNYEYNDVKIESKPKQNKGNQSESKKT